MTTVTGEKLHQEILEPYAHHPTNMVALCPNCHAVKTRGKNTAAWRNELLKVAKAAHDAQIRGRLQAL